MRRSQRKSLAVQQAGIATMQGMMMSCQRRVRSLAFAPVELGAARRAFPSVSSIGLLGCELALSVGKKIPTGLGSATPVLLRS
jgi:hypothetical protein